MIVGIDIGTQSTKAVLANESLEILGEAKASYGYEAPQPGWAEQDPGLWESALGEVIAKLCHDCRMDAGEITVVEELDPFFEEQIRSYGVKVKEREFARSVSGSLRKVGSDHVRT